MAEEIIELQHHYETIRDTLLELLSGLWGGSDDYWWQREKQNYWCIEMKHLLSDDGRLSVTDEIGAQGLS